MLALGAGGIVVLAIVAAVIVLLAIALVPRIGRARAERQLQARREEVAGRHRDEADVRGQHAERAEAEARRARAEADIHHKEADLHEQGLADDRLDAPGGRFTREEETAERDRETR